MSRRLVVLLLVLLPITAPTARADASWSPAPGNLSEAGANAAEPATAVGPSGHVALAWRRLDAAGSWRLHLRVRSASGALGTTQRLSPAGGNASAPAVAVDADGRVFVVWSQRDAATGSYAVLARVRSAAGMLSGIRELSAGVGEGDALRAPTPRLALGPGGAVVAWQAPFAGGYRAVARTLGTDGVADGWQTLSREHLVDRPVALAVAQDGTAVMAWTRDDGVSSRVEARTRTVDGTLGPLRVLTPAGQDATAPAVAVSPGGGAVVAWVREDPSFTSLRSRAMTTTGVVGPARKISLNSHDVDDDPVTGWGEVGVSDDGDAVFVWQQDKVCCGTEVVVRGLSAAGDLSPITFARTTATARQPHVVVAPGGNAVLTFTQLDETFWERIVVRTRSVGGMLGPAEVVSAAGRDAFDPDLAMNRDGLVALTWLREDSSDPACCDRAQYAVGP